MADAQKIAQIQARLTQYIAAEQAILKGQAYSIGNRSLTRADLKEVRETIIQLQREIGVETRCRRIRIQRVVPRDC